MERINSLTLKACISGEKICNVPRTTFEDGELGESKSYDRREQTVESMFDELRNLVAKLDEADLTKYANRRDNRKILKEIKEEAQAARMKLSQMNVEAREGKTKEEETEE